MARTGTRGSRASLTQLDMQTELIFLVYELGSESLCSTTEFWFWPLGYKLRQDLDCKKRCIEGRERERERERD